MDKIIKLTEQEINILIKSLEFISYFPKSLNTTPQEYLKIHQRNIETLSKLSIEKKSVFIASTVEKYETISHSEIEEYIKWKKKDLSFVDLVFGRIISGLISIAKNKGNTRNEIERKLSRISEINIKLKNVIENPYLETVMEQ